MGNNYWLCSHLHESVGTELVATPGGDWEIPLEPNEVVTLRMALEPRSESPVPLSIDPEGVVVSSPWLENRGEGVDGNGIFSVTPRERELVIGSEPASTEIHLFNGSRTETLNVPLTVRASSRLEVSIEPPQVTLPPGESSAVQLTVTPREPWTGRSAIELTALVEDQSVLAAVWVRDEATPHDAPIIRWEVPEDLVPPRGELRATVHNETDGPLRGVISWITPQPAWETLARWREEIDLPPGGSYEFRSRLSSPIDSYAIPRLTTATEISYGPPIALLEMRDQVILSFDVDRVRVAESGIGIANVTARALRDLDAESEITLTAPDGWSATEVGRQFREATDDEPVQWLEVSFAVGASGELGGAGPTGGTLVARGPERSHAVVDATIAPAQRALPLGDQVTIDGEFDEWEGSEFTSATGPLGSVRTAVRYDSGGLVLAMDVKDSTFRQTHLAATIWEGDSVQFALTAAPGTEIGYSNSDLEFGAAKTPEGEIVWCWYGGPNGKTGQVEDAQVAIVPHAGGIRYEYRIPRSRLPGMNLEPGATLGFSYIANDDDGEGYRGATEWTGGMTGGKDSSQFGELFLVPR